MSKWLMFVLIVFLGCVSPPEKNDEYEQSAPVTIHIDEDLEVDTTSPKLIKQVNKSSPVKTYYNYTPKVGNGVVVTHQYYTLSYVEEHEQAEWVAYKLNTTFTGGGAKRNRSFYYDPSVTTRSASASDYKYSGYDRGHLLPAADRKLSKEAMRETFLMSNISPQHPDLNRRAWRELEEQIRDNLQYYDSLYIVTGPVFSGNEQKIGKNEVTVPSHFYKIIVYYTDKMCTTAYLMPNEPVQHVLPEHLVTIDSLESLTGIDFFYQLPYNMQDDFEAKTCLTLR
ncbi:DNA/RNA non-specific endonuclease [Cyclobacteriaceae bacterium]|nr:DNA/RNA non-specific endonuclease [Cyclobacteriaceae bacterium]